MKQILNSCGINQTKIVNLGSARFSSENLNLLNTIYPKNKDEEKLIDNKKIKFYILMVRMIIVLIR